MLARTRRRLWEASRRLMHQGPVYEEEAQLLDIKPEAYYEEQARERNYFYYVDSQGRLFLESTRPKNIVTSIKSPKTLDFFFNMLRPNRADVFPEYPWVSHCGSERNWLKAADCPVVFTDLDEQAQELRYAGSQRIAFVPEDLRMSVSSGRLYHLFHHPRLGSPAVGLISSSIVAMDLAPALTLFSDTDVDGSSDPTQVGQFVWRGQTFALRRLAP